MQNLNLNEKYRFRLSLLLFIMNIDFLDVCIPNLQYFIYKYKFFTLVFQKKKYIFNLKFKRIVQLTLINTDERKKQIQFIQSKLKENITKYIEFLCKEKKSNSK